MKELNSYIILKDGEKFFLKENRREVLRKLEKAEEKIEVTLSSSFFNGNNIYITKKDVDEVFELGS